MKKLSFMLGIAVVTFSILQCTSCEKDEDNSKPTVVILKMEPSTINANGIVNVSIAASDPDQDKLTINYQVTGGTVTGSGTQAFWIVPANEGQYKITASADDGNGGTTSDEMTITVTAPVTQISGIAEIQGGGADLSGAKVFLYNEYPSTVYPAKYTIVAGEGVKAVFNINGITAGDYYILLWKDVDGNGSASMNDLVGWYGTGSYHSPAYDKIQIAEGETFNCGCLKTYIAVK
ncbi:MAG: hypothetical protein HGA37_06885 [Lentimicrobium sp.]|nr:hypothetical protein [Lentimicrobium sp.]